jgi:hypothetical protein
LPAPAVKDPTAPSHADESIIAKEKKLEVIHKYYKELAEQGIQLQGERAGPPDFAVVDGQLWMGKERLTNLKTGKPLKLSQIPGGVQKKLGILVAPSKKVVAALQSISNDLPNIETIELKDLSQVATNAITAVEQALSDAGAQTPKDGLPLREIKALDKSLQRIRGELVNTQAKISAIDGEMARREQKVKDSPNEAARKFQEEKIRELRSQRELHEGVLSTLQGDLTNQFIQIRELIYKVLNDDTTLGERIRTLFREQGVTIVSILTALGFIVSTLALAITGGGGAAATPPPPPANKSGVKEWAKQRLQDLGRLLGKLAEKAGAALPGIIGSIVSWLLSTAQKAVGLLAENLWVLVTAIAGMVYLTAKDYISKN